MTAKTIAAPLFLLLAACSEPPRWEGWIYPNRFDLTAARPVGVFDTLDDCRIAALNRLRVAGSDTFRGDYECGLNCSPGATGVLRVCKSTER